MYFEAEPKVRVLARKHSEHQPFPDAVVIVDINYNDYLLANTT